MMLSKIRKSYILFFLLMSFALVSRPLTILFIVGHFPAPSQTFILNQMTRLIERGHTVLIYAMHYDHCKDVHPDILKYRLFDHLIYDEQKRFDNMPACDIVLCQFGYLGKAIVESPKLTQWCRGKKIVTCLRGADITSRVASKQHMYDTLFEKGDLFLPVCHFLKQQLIRFGCKNDKIKVHHSAIDCVKFHFKRRIIPKRGEQIHFISVSRLVEKKGLYFAIKAIAKLVKEYPHIHLTIVGDGPEWLRLQKLILRLRLEKNITMCGWKTQEEIVRLLEQSHVFVLPSITASDGNEEGIPNALKEAMAMGLPVIATEHAGNTEQILDGVSGYLVPQKDSELLYKKMKYVLEHPEEWHQLCINARQTIEEEFEIDKNIEQLEALFYQLLEM